MEELKKEIEKQINNITKTGINKENLENLYKLVDIHKDIENEEYWQKGSDDMRNYGNYDNRDNMFYGRRMRDIDGRYMGRNKRYKGEDNIDEMREHYMNYNDRRETYGNDNATMRSLEYMLQSVEDFVEMLKRDANSQEEMDLIKKYAKEIGNM